VSNLTKKQRDALPASDFGSPEDRLFPIVDQNDVDSAAHLIGKAKNPEAVKARIVAIAKRKGLKIPDAWQSNATHSASAFTADLAPFGETGGYVLRRGKLFEAGDYPDKSYSMTPEEIMAAVADFQPVPLDLEHTPTVLDGKLGELRAVELGDDGWSLYGTVALPPWLDEQLGGECKVSCTWNRDTKHLQKLALVQNPRISDAAIMAAFVAKRHSASDAKDIQQIHDLTVQQGATCATDDDAGTAGATAKGASMSEQKPSRMDRLMKWLSGDGDEATIAFVEEPKQVAKQEQPQPDPETVRLKAEMAALKAERTQEKAVAFAESEIRAGRAYPAERAAIIAQYVQCATDDAAHGGTVTFADGQTTGTRVEALAALFAARVPHSLTGEQVRVGSKDAQALANQQTTRFMTDQEGKVTKEGLVELVNFLPENEREDVAARITKRFAANGQ